MRHSTSVAVYHLFLENVMQAIQTRILPCTNTKPTRIKAWAWAGEITLSIHKIPASYDVTMHEYAARELANKFNWLSEPYTSLHSGCLANGDHCHVIVRE